jgi:molybdopterin/thiamine biosynthesis adenylyltransferase
LKQNESTSNQQVFFESIGLAVKDNILKTLEGRILGLINPGGYLEFRIKTGTVFAHGPDGYYKVNHINKKEVIRRIIRIKFLIPCKNKDISAVVDLLVHHPLSRSVSYLLNFVRDVSEFIALFNKIQSLRVLILGCGGVGSNVAFLVSSLGFKNLVLVDGDKVEKTNLNRQVLFTFKDLNTDKVAALKRGLQSRFNGLTLETIAEPCTLKNASRLLKKCDIIIVSADTPPSLCDDIVSVSGNKPIFTGGYQLMDCVVKVIVNKKSKNSYLQSAFSFPQLDIPPSSGVINFRVASILVEQIIILLVSRHMRNVEIRLNYNKPKKGRSGQLY